LFFDIIFVIIRIFCLLGVVSVRYIGCPIVFASLDAHPWVLRNGLSCTPPQKKWGDLNDQLGVLPMYRRKKKAMLSEQTNAMHSYDKNAVLCNLDSENLNTNFILSEMHPKIEKEENSEGGGWGEAVVRKGFVRTFSVSVTPALRVGSLIKKYSEVFFGVRKSVNSGRAIES